MKYFLFNLKHSLASFFAYLTFPKECSLCGKIAYAMPLCVDCEKKLISEKITNRCKSCGKELFFEKDFCMKCRQKERFFENCESVYPIFSYVLQKKKLLYMWKVANHREMVFFFGKVCFPIFQERFKNIPIVPVPPRPNKIAEKGWDQIEDLVWILEKKYKLKICRLLERTTKIQQKKLGKEDRLSESKHSYVAKTVKNRKIPKEIVLLDDVITTGSTINSCKEVLLSLGVEKIHCVSLFIVP